MAKAAFDITSIELPPVAAKTLYAGVGAGDIAYTAVKEYVADVQKKLVDTQKHVQKSVTSFDPAAMGKQAIDRAAETATARRTRIENRVSELQADAKALPGKVADVQEKVATTATATYADLAKRGESIVARVRKSAPAAGVEIKSTKTKAVSVKATAGSTKAPARKPATKKTTTVTTAKKSPVKATASTATAKKTTPTAKKTTGTSTAKKTTTRA